MSRTTQENMEVTPHASLNQAYQKGLGDYHRRSQLWLANLAFTGPEAFAALMICMHRHRIMKLCGPLCMSPPH